MAGRYSVFKGKHWKPGSGDCGIVVANYEDQLANATITLWESGECGGHAGGMVSLSLAVCLSPDARHRV
jgi:hypothetical protein